MLGFGDAFLHPCDVGSDEQIAEAGRFRRFAIAPFYHTMPMGSPAQPCTMCFSNGGFGGIHQKLLAL